MRQEIYGAAGLGGGDFAQESGGSSKEVEEASLYGQRNRLGFIYSVLRLSFDPRPSVVMQHP